LRSQSTRVGIT